ncbi:alpha-N-acetylglucosaminidase [Xanthomonas maliensis]|uniref:alpha-N-acetylglucosaminidase n=1 Tax=Xanthomonas maliensis TaxID=1321368 RepID=UPI0003B49E9A|nr:alpha-N-acetylglucosaminidase [Xanthomonas maliensis]KAB7767933.1 alpha-N-acetylglucosaminidase [Xanthomonas maliensis]
MLVWLLPQLALAATPSAPAAQAVLQRFIGARAAQFELQLAPAEQDGDWYRVDAGGDTVRIAGSSPVALSRGAYAYLGQIGAAASSWEGDRVALPAQWPAYRSGQVRTPFAHRAYLNPCTYGYTTPFWDWPRWQREIDWMALHGIDMPLAMEGQEAVWQALWREFGVPEQALADTFSAPPFAPWQRMGNIEGYRAPLPQPWIDRKRELQVKILARMRELGMHPVLPAFAGYVPKAFAQAHPQARIYRMRAWEGFHETYWLDPRDPLFATIARRFLQLYTQTYGSGEFYLADAFNEMLPPVADDGSDIAAASYGDSTANSEAARAKAVPPAQRDARLAAYGQAIYHSIAQVNPRATWVMQGWLFGADREFWQPQAIAAFLGKVPDTHLLVLDIGNDRYPGTWKAAAAFDNKHWIYGYVHNYGGSNPVYGDLAFYQRDLAALLADPARGKLQGFGVFPEGLDTNSLVYEYLYDLAWDNAGTDPAQWFARYAAARYGAGSPALAQAWPALQRGVYGVRYWESRWWNKRAGAYLLFKRPTAQIVDFGSEPGDAAQLRSAIEQLLTLAPQYRAAPLFDHDLADYAGHYALVRLDALLQRAVRAYRSGELADGDAAVAQVQTIATAVDALLAGRGDSLHDWLAQARDYADGDAETGAAYLAAARAQVTVWGGEGNLSDYASKAWNGMIAGYYLPRWQQFLQGLRSDAAAGRQTDEAQAMRALRQWEQAWVQRPEVPPAGGPVDVPAASRALLGLLDKAAP